MNNINFYNSIKNEFIKIKNSVNDNNEIEIHGPIGGDSIFDYGYSFDNFKKDLEKMNGNITISIKSYGGNLFEAYAIYDHIRNLKNHVTTKIIGSSASAGTLISLAGDKRLITKNSRYLIHKPIILTAGNSDDLKRVLDQLEDLDKQTIQTYVDRTNLNQDEVLNLMRQEKFISAEEAVEMGFIDGYINEKSQENTKNMDNMNIKETVINKFLNENTDKIDTIMEFIDKLADKTSEEKTEQEVIKEPESVEDLEKTEETTEKEELNPKIEEPSNKKDEEDEEETKNKDKKDEEDEDEKENKKDDEDEEEDKDKLIEDLKEEIKKLKKQLADNEVDEAQDKVTEIEDFVNEAIDSGKILIDAKDEWLNLGCEQGIEVIKTLMKNIPDNKNINTRLKDVVSTSKSLGGLEDVVKQWKNGEISTEAYLKLVRKNNK